MSGTVRRALVAALVVVLLGAGAIAFATWPGLSARSEMAGPTASAPGLDAGSAPSASATGDLGSPSPSASASRSAALPPGSPVPSPSLAPSPSPVRSPSLVPIGFTLHVPILTYHLIATPAEAVGALPGLVVPPALFDAQLAALQANGWHTITLAALAADLAAHRAPPRHTFVITIDDGHLDGYTEAFPILRRHGMVATYFIIAGRIGHPGYIDAAQLRQLAAAGMEIGDHSLEHVNLAALPASDLWSEVGGAATILRQTVGVAPRSFAYPFGDFDAAVMRSVSQAGLVLAVTTMDGAVEAPNLLLEIPRIHVGPSWSPEAVLATVQRSGDG